MSPFRVVGLICLVAATVVASPTTPTFGSLPESSKALSVLSAGGDLAVLAEPRPAPAADALHLPGRAIPVAPRSTGSPRMAESSDEIVEQRMAVGHPLRGPPSAA